MSIKFSRVKTVINNTEFTFLVGGFPEKRSDLNNWLLFKNYKNEFPENTNITLFIESFLYGEGEIYDATPEEIAYMYKRISIRPDFLEKRARKIFETTRTY